MTSLISIFNPISKTSISIPLHFLKRGRRTEMEFAIFLSGQLTTVAIVNPPDGKRVNPTFVCSDLKFISGA